MAIRPGLKERIWEAAMTYEQKTHEELLAEARRPVESLSVEHVNWLIEMMATQNKWTHPPIYFINV